MMEQKFNIVGCRGKIDSALEFMKKARDFVSNNDILLQFLDADKVIGKEHILSAIEHAVRAFERKDNISETLAMEILIYAAGEPHINNALAAIGLKDGCENIAVIADGSYDIEPLLVHLNLSREDEVLAFNKSKLIEFGITDSEISTVDENKIKDLVLERVAMVDVKK